MGLPILQRKDGTVPAEDDLRHVLREAMKRSRKERDQIVGHMTLALGRTVTGSMLADFTRNASKKRQVRFPAAWVSAFCEATGDDELARFIMGPRLRELVELGERVSSMAWVLEKIRGLLERLIGQGNQNKQPRKA
jgi:hypothetical protein